MELKLCDYNTCLLAKEKRFNEQVYTCYSEETKMLLHTDQLNNIGCEGGLDYDDFFCNYNNQPEFEKYFEVKLISAIQQPVLQQWFREKHNIHIAILPYESYQFPNKYIFKIYNMDFGGYRIVQRLYASNDRYESYELALESALFYSLNLI